MESHDIIDNIEKISRANEGFLVLHCDPIVTKDSSVGNMRAWLAKNVTRVDEGLTVHDLRLVPGPTHTNVIFDVVRPHGCTYDDAELKARIAAVVKEYQPDAVCKITIDDSYVSAH